MKKLNIKNMTYVVHLNDIHLLYNRKMFEKHAYVISAGIVLANEYIMNKEVVKYSIT